MVQAVGSSTFLLGGARSGKSAISEQLATGLGLPVTAVVTAEPIDAEMEDRIERHRADRPAGWSTLEAPYNLVNAVRSVPQTRTVVIDCLTVWLTNLLVRGDASSAVEAVGQELAEVIAARSGPSLVVSNEVGLGLVPVEQFSRSFRDIQGRVNQSMARQLTNSYFVVSGMMLPLVPPSQVLGELQQELEAQAGSQ